MPNFNATTLQSAMEDNIRQKFSYLADRLNSMQVHRTEGLHYVDCGLESDTFNTVFGAPSPENVALVTSYYQERNYPAAWWLAPSVPSGAQKLLRDQLWILEECDIGMYLPMINMPLPKAYSIVKIKPCITIHEYHDFGKILSSIFERNPLEAQNVAYVYNQLAPLPKTVLPNLELFIGYEEEEPVSTVALFFTNTIAGIFDLATHPQKRRQGYGSAMLSAALHLAQKRSVEFCVLQASPQGLSLYKNLGFKPLGEFHVWSNSNTLPHTE